MRFYYAPGTCALGIHVVLEETGAAYDPTPVSLRDREQFGPAFRAVNAKGKVPTLMRPDGSVLTEWGTIATWIALAHPAAGLLPGGEEGRLRVQEFLEHLIGTVHMRGFTLVAKPDKFSDDAGAQEDIRAAGRVVVAEGLAMIADRIGDKDWVFDDYSIADAAVFYLTFWATGAGYDMPQVLRDFHARMLARPAVQSALRAEGLAG